VATSWVTLNLRTKTKRAIRAGVEGKKKYGTPSHKATNQSEDPLMGCLLHPALAYTKRIHAITDKEKDLQNHRVLQT
jgi:hypothetical protein